MEEGEIHTAISAMAYEVGMNREILSLPMLKNEETTGGEKGRGS